MERQFNILLAEKVIGICPLYSEIRKMCADYLTEEEADFMISISEDDILYERMKSDKEATLEGHNPIPYSDSYLETLAIYRKIATKLLEYDTLLFHGSVIAVDGVGYLFTAKSGTGKSTHTKLWRELFGSRAVMINDDKPLLKMTDSGIVAYGTPWDGKHHLSTNTAVPLKAICVLERSEINHIELIDKRNVFSLLCQQSFRPNAQEGMIKSLYLIERLSHGVELYRLGCNMEIEAAQVAYEGMK